VLSPGWVWLRSGGGGVSSASGFENPKIKIKDFFPHFLRPSLFSNCRSRIESKNTLAHLVKVDDCFELRLHWGRELQVGNGRRIGRRFV
jgi:hypothetical protein